MSIKYKLFTIFILITSFTMGIGGWIYVNDLKVLFEKQVEINIKFDKEKSHEYIENIENKIQSLAYTLVSNENVLSSLNLISKYEDPTNYSKDTFDVEKNTLLNYSKQWLSAYKNVSVNFYDNKKDLILVYRKNKKKETGFVSYTENGKRKFMLQDGSTLQSIPFVKDITPKELNTLSTFHFPENYVFSFIKQVFFDQELVGFVRVCYSFNEKDVEELSKLLIYPKIFETKDKKLLFTKNMTRLTKAFIENPDYELQRTLLVDNENPLFSTSLIDKKSLNSSINQAILKVAFLGIAISCMIFLVIYFSLNKIVLSPVESLRLGIKKIKKGDYTKIENENNDEFASITKEFNSLSTQLSKNISFLENYKYILDAGNIVSKSDLNGNITYVNDNFCSISGYTREEIIGKPHSISRHPDVPKKLFRDLWDTLLRKETWSGTLKNRKKDGGEYWINMVVHPILDEKGNTIEYIAARHDITEVMEQREKLKTIAHTDFLTGYGNRYKLLEDMNECSSEFLGIALLNIDQFTQLNDFYGHEFGDKVISSFGKSLDEYIEDKVGYSLYHLQGDEFVILGRVKKELFLNMMQKLVQTLNKKVLHVKGEEVAINFTVALSFEDKNSLLSTVDMGLKIARRNKQDIFVYSKEVSLEKEYSNNFHWIKKIKDAIEDSRIIPFFQPIIETKTKEIKKYECLMRLKEDGEEEKIVTPFFFLDIAKQSRQYISLTTIMLEKSFAYFAEKPYDFSLNLTIDDILHDTIQKQIFTLLNHYEGIGERVVFEIVESESIRDFEHMRQFIKDVKTYGCSIAIDDFGTGYSNFSYLIELNVDFIKIDGSLIKNVHTNENHQAVVETIVMFAKKNSIKTVAEFVSSKDVYDKVKSLDIDYVQGYYLGAPSEFI